MTIQVHVDKVEAHSGLTDAQAGVLQQILDLITAVNQRTIAMASAFDTLQGEMQQTKQAVDALVAGLNDLRTQLAAAAQNGLTADQVTALVKLADDTQTEAQAALAGGAPAPAPTPPPAG